MFDNVDHGSETNFAQYRIDSEEAVWNVGQPDRQHRGYTIPRGGGYHACPPQDRLAELRSEAVEILEQIGIPIRYHHHEVGGPGQCEIEPMMGPMLKMADAIMIIKYVVRMVADRRGKTATFMPKPLHGEAGSGLHFHQHLFERRTAGLLRPKAGYAGLSKLAESYTAGLLEHGPSLLALTNPSTNSFKRLVPGFEAPTNLFYSLGNRSAAIRVPKYATLPAEKRVEFRPPDATCNGYLAMAAMLMAGSRRNTSQARPARARVWPDRREHLQVDRRRAGEDQAAARLARSGAPRARRRSRVPARRARCSRAI